MGHSVLFLVDQNCLCKDPCCVLFLMSCQELSRSGCVLVLSLKPVLDHKLPESLKVTFHDICLIILNHS
jgi:hypothetical protein